MQGYARTYRYFEATVLEYMGMQGNTWEYGGIPGIRFGYREILRNIGKYMKKGYAHKGNEIRQKQTDVK